MTFLFCIPWYCWLSNQTPVFLPVENNSLHFYLRKRVLNHLQYFNVPHWHVICFPLSAMEGSASTYKQLNTFHLSKKHTFHLYWGEKTRLYLIYWKQGSLINLPNTGVNMRKAAVYLFPSLPASLSTVLSLNQAFSKNNFEKETPILNLFLLLLLFMWGKDEGITSCSNT